MINHTDPRPFNDAGADPGANDAAADPDIGDARADPEAVVYTRSDGECPAHSVVEAVAETTHTDPTRLRPLYEVIDPDALNDLISGSLERPQAPEDLTVTFQFEGCDVVVCGNGRTVASRSTSASK